jgi:hypothetical protein
VKGFQIDKKARKSEVPRIDVTSGQQTQAIRPEIPIFWEDNRMH